jgi:hypothetical protein
MEFYNELPVPSSGIQLERFGIGGRGEPRQTANREWLHEFGLDNLQAAGFCWNPSMKIVPLMTSANSGEPLKDRKPYDAASLSLKTIARHAARLPSPLVLSHLSRTVENTLSIGLVVRMCTQCTVGYS